MKRFKLAISENPSFNTVLNLTNTTFDPNNVVEGRMATEDQVQQLSQDIADLEKRNDYCCRDIVVWRSYVRVVAENTGIVISDWLDNYATGTSRRGRPFTVEFALPHDATKYLMDRSQPVSTVNYMLRNFGFHISRTGEAQDAETIFYTRVGQPFDYSSSSVPSFTRTTAYLTSSGNTKVEPTGILPNVSSDGYYYFYKDSTDNKIKIDVRINNKFGTNEYFAIFLAQFVLKADQTM